MLIANHSVSSVFNYGEGELDETLTIAFIKQIVFDIIPECYATEKKGF